MMWIKSIADCAVTVDTHMTPSMFAVDAKTQSGIISPNFDVGFRYGFLLWLLRGSNNLSQLQFYSDFLDDLSDNGVELRGAIGTRLRFWVGADQLQDAINTNMDIEDGQDFVKPDGVDQIYNAVGDLTSGMNTTTMVIYDPAIDFEDSNDIPDLLSISFTKDNGKLNAVMSYGVFDLNSNVFNEMYAIQEILHAISVWIGYDIGNIYVQYNLAYGVTDQNAIRPYKIENYDIQEYDIGDAKSYWNDMIEMYEIERHIRNMVKDQYFENENISVAGLCVDLKDRIMNNINSTHIQSIGLGLLLWAMKTKATRHIDDCDSLMVDIFKELNSVMSYHIAKWLDTVGDNHHELYNMITEVLED